MPASKFNFLGEDVLGKINGDPFQYRVHLNKGGMLNFPREVIDTFEMKDNFVKFFVDIEKKTVGWCIIRGKTELPELHSARKVHPAKGIGNWQTTVKKLLKAASIDSTYGRKSIPVFQYKGGHLDEEINYIELNDKPKYA